MIIEVKDLAFSYTKKTFIEEISFNVGKGEIFGFLGPSGAGKSTIQKIMIGLVTNYRGSVKLLGVECKEHNNSFYENIGVDFEYSTMYDKLTAYQNLTFFSSLYSKKPRDINKLLQAVGLENDAHKKVKEYSKGMRSRLNFIKALVHDPGIIFLDEPTSGLDPSNARIMKDLILAEKAQGKTIIITTHNMSDAAQLCDRVAFIVDGKIVALDSPANLIKQRGFHKVTYADEKGEQYVNELQILYDDKHFIQLLKENKLSSIHSDEPNLNDIFIEVTGRKLQRDS